MRSSDNKVHMYAVLSDTVNVVWDKVIPLLIPALEVEGGLYGVDDIYYKLSKKELQLWVGFKGDNLVVFGITSICNFPEKRIATLVYVGGTDMPSWKHLLNHIHDFARSHDCDEIEVRGRKGWIRALASSGYEHASTVLRKVLVQH